MNADEQIEVLQAYKDGKVIEYSVSSGFKLLRNNTYHFNFQSHTYRIKKESGKERLLKDIKCILHHGSQMTLGVLHNRIEDGDYDDFTGEL